MPALFEPGKAHGATGDLARARPLPAPVGVGGAEYSVVKDLLGDLGPPDLGVLGVHAAF
ncbi:MAG TPA: hypothetical protein VNE42_04075 [Acidimicrobiales bacterium]|nr:hypothetical protein [Acidimicrobiales bacterium]